MNHLRLSLLLSVFAWGVTACTTFAEPPRPDTKPKRDVSQATHRETGTVCRSAATRCKEISSFCLAPSGNLLVCDVTGRAVKVVSPADELVGTWSLGVAPSAVAVSADGTAYVVGSNKLLKVDKTGKVEKTVDLGQSAPDVCVAGGKVLVVVAGGTGFDVLRFDADLTGKKRIANKLRGCCGQMDIAAYAGGFVVAENARKKVKLYDLEGKLQREWGEGGRTQLEHFGSCCNPMNVFVIGEHLYTAESTSPEARVKRYSLEGKLLGLVGTAKGPSSCTRVNIAMTPDERTLFFLDRSVQVIRVLVKE